MIQSNRGKARGKRVWAGQGVCMRQLINVSMYKASLTSRRLLQNCNKIMAYIYRQKRPLASKNHLFIPFSTKQLALSSQST